MFVNRAGAKTMLVRVKNFLPRMQKCQKCQKYRKCQDCQKFPRILKMPRMPKYRKCQSCAACQKWHKWKKSQGCEECQDGQEGQDCREYRNRPGCQYCWKSKISQDVPNLGLLWKNRLDFRKKNLNFFQNGYGWQICCIMVIKWFYFSKISSALINRFFLEKIRKLWTLENLEIMKKKECFLEKKNVFTFLQAFFTKMGRSKVCRW